MKWHLKKKSVLTNQKHQGPREMERHDRQRCPTLQVMMIILIIIIIIQWSCNKTGLVSRSEKKKKLKTAAAGGKSHTFKKNVSESGSRLGVTFLKSCEV